MDGKFLIYGDKDGWRLNTPSELELQGAACAAIKSGDHDLKIEFSLRRVRSGRPQVSESCQARAASRVGAPPPPLISRAIPTPVVELMGDAERT